MAKIICIYAPGNGGGIDGTCNSTVCPHRVPHNDDAYPEDGGCKWALDPHCVPFSARSAVERIMRTHFSNEEAAGIAGLVLTALGIEEEENRVESPAHS